MALELKPGEAANLLSLDGGGIKGISTLYILQAIMDKVREIENKTGLNSSKLPRLPVDYFHLAAGTSTGGIIAVMLFRLRMSIKDTIDEYMAIGPQVFGVEAKSGPSRFLEKPLLDCIDKVITTYGRTEAERKDSKNALLVDNQAKMFMCSTLKGRPESIILRSYNMPKDAHPVSPDGKALYDLGAIEKIPIRVAARATSAAPTYFPPAPLDVKSTISFWDGGLLNNNPIDQLWRARLDLVGDDEAPPKVACVVSLGTSWCETGTPNVIDKHPVAKSFVKALEKLPLHIGDDISRLVGWIMPALESVEYLTNTETKHLDFQRYIQRISHRNADPDAQTKYFRFNVPTKEYIDMADYKQMQLLVDRTQAWLKTSDAIPWVTKAAEILAKKAK